MKLIKNLYLTNRLIYAILAIIAVLLLGFSFDIFYTVGRLLFYVLLIMILGEFRILFIRRNGQTAKRIVPEILSYGDPNDIKISIESNYGTKTFVRVIDELTEQLQIRNLLFSLHF